MLLPDVNVLVYAHRRDSDNHERFRNWLENLLVSDAAFGMATLVLSGFLRIVTHPKIFQHPSPPGEALDFVEAIVKSDNCVLLSPGPRHWEIFSQLCRDTAARGNLIPDAYLAAIAIESGSEWITEDRGFRRFPGLRWRTTFSTCRESFSQLPGR